MKLRQLIIPLILIMTLMALVHWFIFSMATLSFTDPPLLLQIIFVIGWLLIPSSLILGMSPLKAKMLPLIMTGYVWLGTLMIFFFFSCVQMIASLANFEMPAHWILIATPIIALWSLRINFMKPRIIQHKLKGHEVMHNLKVVQISDLHVGQSILRKNWLDGVVKQVMSLKPDLVVVTGDLADGRFEKTVPMLEPLNQINVPKYYVTGNHEYISGGDWEPVLERLGFEVLHNTHSLLKRPAGTLILAGVPDRGVHRFRPGLKSDPDQALKSPVPVHYSILLAHEPSSVFDIKSEKCDLLLAGHTHGGQIFPFGAFVRLQQPVSAGFKKINNVNVFAHTGTGFWGPPMRWFTRSEIVELTWH